MLWYVLITLGYGTSLGLLYYGFTKDKTVEPSFRLAHLFVGRRSIAESSRTQLLVEGFFGIALSTAALVYKLLL
jgi:hypothetical protein